MEKFRVILLASYCSGMKSNCTEEKPCKDCLEMCNTYEIDEKSIKIDRYKGEFGKIKESK